MPDQCFFRNNVDNKAFLLLILSKMSLSYKLTKLSSCILNFLVDLKIIHDIFGLT